MKNAIGGGPICAMALAAGVLAPATAMAHEGNDVADQDIVVTATKRAQGVNEVEAAVSVFTAEDRTRTGIETTQDIANFTPGLAISDTPNRVSIRGIGRVTNELGSDPGVANYVDGFYTSESDVIGGSDFSVERVEVLRGPQGTLYGRNSIGGAVNVITKRPTADWRFDLRAGLSDYERWSVAGAVSGPITPGIRVRLSGTRVKQERGFVKNLAGPDQWTQGSYAVEGQVEADITPTLNWWLKLGHSAYDRAPRPDVAIDPWRTTPYHGGLVANPTFGLDPSLNPGLEDPYKVAYNYGGRQRLRNQFGATTQLSVDTGAVSMRYIGGYSQYDYFQDRDFDRTGRTSFGRAGFGTVFPVSTNYVEVVEEKKRWTSHELNILSSPGGRFDWILGAYYYWEHIDQPYSITVPDVALFDNPVELAGVAPITNPQRAYYYQRGEVRSEALAGFGQLTWRFSPGWSLTGGARYTFDHKSGHEEQFQIFYDVAVDPGNTYGISNRGRPMRDQWGGFTGNLGVGFEPSDNTLLYANVSQGYKSGGFKLGGFIPRPIVEKETITAYELGLKQRIGALQWNSALFYYDYHDLQVPVSFEVAPGIVQSIFTNAPRSHAFGAETELSYRPVPQLMLRAIYGYLDARFDRFAGVVDPASASSAPQDLEGDRLPQSPRHKLTLNALATLGDVSVSLTQSFVASQYFSVFNTDRYRAPSYRTTSARIVWDASSRLRLVASASNIFDTTSYSYVSSSSFALGAVRSVVPRAPRTFDVEVRLAF